MRIREEDLAKVSPTGGTGGLWSVRLSSPSAALQGGATVTFGCFSEKTTSPIYARVSCTPSNEVSPPGFFEKKKERKKVQSELHLSAIGFKLEACGLEL